MKKQEFRKFLKRFGKKDHVVDGLIKYCEYYEKYLQENRNKTFENSSKEDISAFIEFANLYDLKIKQYLRSINLYYNFIGKTELSR